MATAYGSINYEASNTKSILVALTGSQEKATEAMEYARKVANLLGVDVNETSKTWVNFDNTMHSLGQTTEQSKSLFESLSYAIIKSGGSMDDVNETVEEFREGLTEGTINGENLEQILRERLPRAFDGMAQAVGVSNEELGKMLEEGMDIQEMLPLLEKGIKSAFGDPTQITGVDAAVGRLKNSIQNLFTDTTTGSMDTFASAIDSMAKGVDGFNRMIEEGQADVTKWLGQIAAIADYVSGNIKSFDDLQKKLKELDETHASDLKMIGAAHEETGKKAKESGDKQVAAAVAVSPAWKAVSKTIDDLIKDYDRLSGTSQLVGSVLSEVGKNIDFSKPTESVDLITSSMEKLREKSGMLTTDVDQGLKPAFQGLSDSQLNKMLGEVTEQIEKGQMSVENYSLKTALANEQQQRLGTSTVELARTTAELAEKDAQASAEVAKTVQLRGNQREVAEANLVTKQKEMKAAETHVQLMVAERNEAQRQLDADIALEGGINNVSEAKRREFQARQNTINAKNDELVVGLQTISQLENEKNQLEGNTRVSTYYLNALQKIIDADTKRLESQGSVIDSNIRRLEAEKKLAEASGDMATAAQKQNEIDSETIRQAENVVAIERTRLASLENRYSATLSQALADGEVTEAEQEKIASLEQEIQAQQSVVSASQASVDATQAEIDAKNKATEAGDKLSESNKETSRTYTIMASAGAKSVGQLQELSAGTRNMVSAQAGLFSAMTKGAEETSEELEKLKTHLAGTESAIMRNAHNAVMFRGEFMRAIDAANNTWKAYDEQAIAAEQSIIRLTNATADGGANMIDLQNAISGATNQVDLLDRARLDRLNAAIDAANEKLREMQREAEDARLELEDLNAEIEREKGNTDEADRLTLQTEKTKELADLEEKIDKARRENNKELLAIYEEQKRKLEELYNLKNDNLEADIKQRNEEERATNSKTTNESTSKPKPTGSGTSSGSSGTTHTLQLKGPDNSSVAIPGVDQEMVNQVMDILKKSGMRLAG